MKKIVIKANNYKGICFEYSREMFEALQSASVVDIASPYDEQPKVTHLTDDLSLLIVEDYDIYPKKPDVEVQRKEIEKEIEALRIQLENLE